MPRRDEHHALPAEMGADRGIVYAATRAYIRAVWPADSRLEDAIDAVTNRGMSVRAAAGAHGIDRKVLARHWARCRRVVKGIVEEIANGT